MKLTRTKNPVGTQNVLVDLGFEDAEELSAKLVLAIKLNDLIEKRGLTQMQASAIVGMPQSKISQIRRFKVENISLERLMQALVSLNQRVEISIKPARRMGDALIRVVA